MLKPKASQKSGWRKDRRAKCLFCIGWVFRGESFSSSSFPFASLSFLLVSPVTVYAGLRNIGASKQKHWLIKLKVGLKVQMEKEKMKVIRLWKPNYCKKGRKEEPTKPGWRNPRARQPAPNWAAPVPPRVSSPRPRSVACSWREKKTEQHRTAETLPCTNVHGYPLPNNPKKPKQTKS